MQDTMFSALFGALTTEHRMNYIANNLANVNTNGYKKDQLAFKDTMSYYAHDEIREPLMTLRSQPLFPEPKNLARSRIACQRIDFSQGAMHVTGNKLDIAIAGDGFFSVQTPTGEFFTRNGHFVNSGDGTIMTPQGWPLMGDSGPIVIPPGTHNLAIGARGEVEADGQLLGVIRLTSVDDPKKLEKMGHNLFRVKKGMSVEENDAYAGGARTEQGFLEKANVEVVTEMVNMIEVNRLFEAYQKVMQTSDTVDKDAIQKVGRRA